MIDWSTVPTFGTLSGRFPVQDRPSAYAIIPNAAAHLAVVRTATGHYLPGGGIEMTETVVTAVMREVVEECGFTVTLTAWRAAATEFVSAEAEMTDFVKRSTFCEATLVGGSASCGAEHMVEWQSVEAVIQMLTPASHRWAVREWARHLPLERSASEV